MSQFGNQLPNLIAAPAAIPNMTGANTVGSVASVLGDVLKIGGAVVANKADVQRRQLENQSTAARLKVGEQEVEQARARVELQDRHTEIAKLALDTDEQRRLYDDLVNAEQLGVTAKRAQMTPEEWEQYVSQHPIVDPVLANQVGRAMGHQWAETATTEMFQQLAAGAVSGEMPSAQVLVDQQLRKYAPHFAAAHPAAVDAFKTKILEVANGYVRGEQANRIAEYQRQTNASVDAEIGSIVGRTYLGEIKPEDMLARSAEQAMLMPGMRRPDGSLDQKNFESYLAVKIQHYAKSVTQNPTANLAPLKSLIDAMPQRVQRDLQGFGVQTEIADTEKRREEAHAGAMLQQFTERAVDIERADDIPSMMVLRQQANASLKGETRTTALLDLDSRIVKMQKTMSGANQVVEILAGRQTVSAENRPSGEALNKGWARATAFMPPDQALAAFVSKGLEVPSDAIQQAKDAIATGKPMQALSMVTSLAGVSRDKAKLVANQIDPKGLLAMSITLTTGMKDDDPEKGSILTTLGAPASEVHLQTAKTILKDKEHFSAIDQIQQHLNLTAPPLISETSLDAFSDRFSYRFIEAMNSGLDQTTAIARASQIASRETTANLTTVMAPNGEGWLGGNDRQPVLVDKGIFGDLSEPTVAPNARAGMGGEQFWKRSDRLSAAMDELYDATGNSPARPDLAFKSNNSTFVPAIGNDGTVQGFMEWDSNVGKSVRVITAEDSDFANLNQLFEPGEAGAPFYLMRNRPEYGVSTLQQYDAKYPGRNLGAQVWTTAADNFVRKLGRRPNLNNPTDLAMIRTNFIEFSKYLVYATDETPAPNDSPAQK